MGERQSIAQKGVRAIDARNSQLENGSNAAKTSVRAPGLSPDEREHPFVWYFGAGWKKGGKLSRKDIFATIVKKTGLEHFLGVLFLLFDFEHKWSICQCFSHCFCRCVASEEILPFGSNVKWSQAWLVILDEICHFWQQWLRSGYFFAKELPWPDGHKFHPDLKAGQSTDKFWGERAGTITHVKLFNGLYPHRQF